MTTLTAQDVARHIQRPGEPRIAAVDRFRNWAKMGLIKPIGERNPGTGRKKRYSKSAVLEAILLQTLTDALGSSAASSIGLVERISKMVRHGPLLGAGMEVLVIGRHSDEAMSVGRVKLKDLPKYFSDSDLDVHVVLNLKDIYKRHNLTFDDWKDLFPERASSGRK